MSRNLHLHIPGVSLSWRLDRIEIMPRDVRAQGKNGGVDGDVDDGDEDGMLLPGASG